ncbi:DNA cytosine methyltransferase [Paracoccus sp. ME4]|uniref:DNA cytosine methyltransferase n=1 Tax=Paracoccus sp. ME4 TaxID=3138066 RepID=UPI00398BB7F3
MWASPDCKHFSKAKGGAPRDRNIRDLAWAGVPWAEFAKPDVICMENVEEFVTWGPVDNDGQPIKEFAGQTFELWIGRLKKAGYKVQWRELRACDYGAPTIRKRWFLVARRDGRPIVWPKPTHGNPASAEVRKGRLQPWIGADTCIDWSLPCPSIFDSAAEVMARHGLRAIRPLAGNTLARVARGMKRYVLDAERPFLVSLKGTARRDSAVSAPHPTVLAGGGHSALIAPSLMRTDMTSAVKRNGIYSLKDPVRTQMTSQSFALIAPLLATMRNSQKPWQRSDDPVHTITAGGAGLTVIAPVLTYAQQGGGNRAATDPHHTICASKKDQNSLIAATMVQTGYGERPGQHPRALDVAAPLGTVVAGGAKHAPVAAFLAQQNGEPRMEAHAGHDARDPLSTVAASGSHQTPVAAWFAKYYGTGDGARTDEPCHTVTVKDRMGHMQAELAAPPFAPEHHARARAVADFLRAHDAWDGGEFVTLTISGATYVVIDIGMRMLTPRELFRAQGFPADYVIEGVWDGLDTASPTWRPFAKDVQVSCCGNSVCPPLAEALVAANCGHLNETRTDEETA